MLVGFSLGVDRGERFVSIDEYDENQETVSNSIVFPNRMWNRFLQLLSQIDDCFMSKECVEFKQQLKGPCFLSITTCYHYINLCEFFYNPVNGSGPEIVTNLIIPLADWFEFKTKIQLINEQFTAPLSYDYA